MKKLQFDKIFFLALILALVLSSCEDVVEVDISDEDLDLISVEAYITTKHSNNILVSLKKSLPIDNAQENPPIHNAVVEISDDEPVPNTVLLQEYQQSGIYLLPANTIYEAIPGRTYKLKITSDDGTIITGEEYLQKVETLDSVRVNLSPLGDYEYLAIYINSQETPGEGNYYKWDIYINNRLLYGSDNLTFASDELVDGNYIYDLELFVDWYDDDEDKILFIGDTVKVQQLSITKATYDFYLGMQNQAFSGSPFSVPPANIANNLSSNNNKRVLGIFSARDISVGNMVIIDSTNFSPMVPTFNY
jgi:hypothetical protein